MEILKLYADTGASIAAIVAISITLFALLRKTRKPLKIKRAAIFIKRPEKSNYHLRITNRKDYPITINAINGYSERTYTVVKKKSQNPISEGVGFRSSTKIFENNEEKIIDANGSSDIFTEGQLRENIKNIYLWIQTSQNDQIIKCSSVEIIDDGNFEVFDDSYYFDHPLKAKIVYYGLFFSYTKKWAKDLGEKWRRSD